MAEQSILLGGIQTLRELGIFDFLLPFLLFFAMVYAVLGKSQIFADKGGNERKDINAIIAFVIAIIATTTSWVLLALNQYIPWIAFMLVAILGFLLVASFVYGRDLTEIFYDSNKKEPTDIAKWIVAIIGIVIVLGIVYALRLNVILKEIGISGTDIGLVIIMIAVGIFLYYMFK